MNSIFISHAWTDTASYEELVSAINGIIGVKSWINVSIPQNEAIEISNIGKDLNEIESLENHIIHLEAKLRDSNLPDVVSRVIFDSKGNRKEVETKGSVMMELNSLVARIRELKGNNPIDDINLSWLHKGAGRNLALNPELGNAIRRRIQFADLIFLLVSPSCMLRSWVYYEYEIARGSDKPMIGVLSGGYHMHELDVFCSEVISMDKSDINRIVNVYL